MEKIRCISVIGNFSGNTREFVIDEEFNDSKVILANYIGRAEVSSEMTINPWEVIVSLRGTMNA